MSVCALPLLQMSPHQVVEGKEWYGIFLYKRSNFNSICINENGADNVDLKMLKYYLKY